MNRKTVFSRNCNVTIYDPPNTDQPFIFPMTSSECDSLSQLLASAPPFDSVYYNANQHIPNPASTILEFTRNGVVRQVRISQYPPLPSALVAILSCAGTIELRGLNLMEKQEEERVGKQRMEQEQEQEQNH